MADVSDFRPDQAGLEHAVRVLLERMQHRGSPHVAPDAADVSLPRQLPEIGIGGGAALDALAQIAFADVSRLDHPGFLAHMDPPTPWYTWAAAMWAAATNQNVLHPDTAPAARALESHVVAWLARVFGLSGGHMVPGSTVANLTALWAARELTGATRVVTSEAAHLSVVKSADILGMECVQVPVDDKQQLRTELLPPDLSDSVVVLTAGTVATGAVDDLHAGQGAAWRHVDAAWAGALRLSSHTRALDGIETADSVGVSLHKWLYQPKGSALVLFADAERAHEAISYGGGYLAVPNVGLLGSRGSSALPLAITLLAWGRQGIAEQIDAGMAMADELADLVTSDAELELWHRPCTGVVNWRPVECDPESVRERITGAWVSTATIDGDRWFRSVAANPLADPRTVVSAVKEAMNGSRREN